jgi:hypothetical protein
MPVKTLRDLEGELTLDHRDSPGVPADMLHKVGLPAEAGRGLFQTPIYTCGHCQRGVTVIVKPFGMREKRYVCSQCRKVLCDECGKRKALTGMCDPFEAKVERYLKAL